MSSKFIPKSRIKQVDLSPFKYEWSSDAINFDGIVEDNKNPLQVEKERIESIPLNELTFKDLYQFPFHQKYSGWVYDSNDNFLFQFERVEKETREKFIQIINNELTEYKRQDVTSKDGEIFIDGKHFITIRGWGNLTGCGAYNLEGDYACKIQDTLLEYIVDKIKK